MMSYRYLCYCKLVFPTHSILLRRNPSQHAIAPYHVTAIYKFPMKPGTPIPGLDIYKDKDPVVALARSEYPDWVNELATPMLTLSELRRLPESEATEKDKMRYLKLTRRIQIKKNNAESAGKKR